MIKEGIIVKLIGDLYSVLSDGKVFDCKARGKFRNEGISPLVGDQILFDVDKKYIMEIKPRHNELKRPPIANVDYAIIVTSLVKPDVSYNLLDKLLSNIIINNIKPIIVITKSDIASKKVIKDNKNFLKYYQKLGIPVLNNNKIRKLMKIISHKTVVLSGQTGAGKSSLLNKIDKKLELKTGEISESLNRGKHTTRHVEFFKVGKSLIADTPGFSALDLDNYSKEEIKASFIEFSKYNCKYKDCDHLTNKECAIYDAVQNNKILKTRYENYQKMVERK